MHSNSQGSQKPSAIIIGLDSLQGIQAARILAHRGVPVIAIAGDPKHYSCRTNVCQKILFANTDDEIINTLETVGPALRQKAVLVPCQDGKVSLVSQHRDLLEQWYHVLLPSADTVEMLMNKIGFYTYAQEQGLPIPKTFFLKNREDAEHAVKNLSFPCILKPPTRSAKWTAETTLKAFKIADEEDFFKHYDHFHQFTDVLVAQEWIAGDDTHLYSCNCYFNADSEPIATFVARKLRQWPPRTGQSCLGEECRDDIVLHETLRLFRSVNYRGLGYVEMKRDANSGKYFLVEPNIGRPTGRSAIAEAGGVELLYTMYCDALGLPLPSQREQKYESVKWVHLRRDFQSALYYWRQGELTLKGWWQSMKGRKAYALLSWKDPGPFLSDITRTVQLLLSPQERLKRASKVGKTH